ncbi:MAG: hypothetical protein ACTJLK_03250 [Anaplasma sp.]
MNGAYCESTLGIQMAENFESGYLPAYGASSSTGFPGLLDAQKEHKALHEPITEVNRPLFATDVL